MKDVVTPSLEKLKQKYFPYHPDEPVILHRRELVSKKYSFNSLKDKKIEEKFNSEFLKLLSDLDYIAVSVLIDKMAKFSDGFQFVKILSECNSAQTKKR